MSIDDVIAEWKQDSKIDMTNLAVESSRSPSLHAKYLDYYVVARKKLLKCQSDAASYAGRMAKYYRGEMSLEECQSLNLDQWQHNKLNTTQIQSALDSDERYQSLKDGINYWTTYCESIESILGSLKQRDFAIGNAIKFILYTNGAQV